MPLVSVGLPVYNGEHYLGEAIESILEQSERDLELVISDNASTDSTPDIIDSYARMDGRIRWTRFDENRGAAANYNFVFHGALGRYFTWAAHDDIMKPDFVRVCLEAHDRIDQLATAYPRSEFIDAEGAVTHPDVDTQQALSGRPSVRAYRMLERMSMAHAVFGLHDAEVLRRTALIGNYVSSDYVLLLQLSLLGRIVQVDTEPLFQRRVHPGMSRVANRTKDEVLSWFDPEARSRLSEQNRLRLEYAKSPFVVRGLPPAERVVSAGAVIGGFTLTYVRAKRGIVLR